MSLKRIQFLLFCWTADIRTLLALGAPASEPGDEALALGEYVSLVDKFRITNCSVHQKKLMANKIVELLMSIIEEQVWCEWLGEISQGTQGQFALFKAGDPEVWTSYTGRSWYSGTAGAALSMIKKAFYRYGQDSGSLLEYALVRPVDGDKKRLEEVARFHEIGDGYKEDERTRGEKISDTMLKYKYAWMHLTTGQFYQPDGHKDPWRRSYGILHRMFLDDQRELDESSLEDFVVVRRNEKSGSIVVTGPVFRGADSGLNESQMADLGAIMSHVAERLRQGEDGAKLLKILEDRSL